MQQTLPGSCSSIVPTPSSNLNLIEPSQLLPPDEVDVFFHHLDSSGNATNSWPYPPGARAHPYRPTMCQMTAHGPTAFPDPQSQVPTQPGSCSRVFLPTARVPSSQVCRPHHFHTPIQWIESKSASNYGCSVATPPSVWCPPFPQSHRSSVSVSSPVQVSQGSSSLGHPIFAFPPTPPKDLIQDNPVKTILDPYGYPDEKSLLKAGMQFSGSRPDSAYAPQGMYRTIFYNMLYTCGGSKKSQVKYNSIIRSLIQKCRIFPFISSIDLQHLNIRVVQICCS